MPVSTSARRPFFGVRIILCWASGASSRMDFTNNELPLSALPKDILVKYAVGEMLSIACGNGDSDADVRQVTDIRVIEIDRHGNAKPDPNEDFVLVCEDCGKRTCQHI